MDQLVYQFIEKTLRGHIHNLKLFQGKRVLLEGYAPVFISKDNRLVMELCAPAPQGEDPRLLSGLSNPSEPIEFSGDFVGTPIRQPYKVSGICGGSIRGHCSAADHRWWTQDVQEMRLDFDSIDLGTCRFQGLVQPWPHYSLSTKTAKIKDENALFGEILSYYDHLSFDYGDLKIGIRSNDTHNVGEIVAAGDSKAAEGLPKISEALLKAVSLRWGYELEWLTASYDMGKREMYKIFPDSFERQENHKWQKPPIVMGPFDDGTNERFLRLAIDYFLDKDDVDLFKYMRTFWRTGPTDCIELRESVLGPAIEGISKQVVTKRASADEKAEIGRAEDSFKKCKKELLETISNNAELVASEHYEQFRKTIEIQDYRVAKRLISLAANILGFSVSEQELKAWGEMRNDAAHGRNIYSAIDRKRAVNFERCVTLLNKFCMALIGYSGFYENYASADNGQIFQLRS